MKVYNGKIKLKQRSDKKLKYNITTGKDHIQYSDLEEYHAMQLKDTKESFKPGYAPTTRCSEQMHITILTDPDYCNMQTIFLKSDQKRPGKLRRLQILSD